MPGSCPEISDLKLTKESERALNDVKSVIKNSEILQRVMLSGSLVNALVSDKAIPQLFNVSMTDWEALGLAIQAVPAIAKNRIQLISGDMALRTKGREYVFWKAMYDLCMFN